MIGLSAYVAIAGGLLIALWKHPGVALAGVLCMFGLEQWGQATTTFFAQHQTATNYLIGGILVLALLSQGLKGGFSLFDNYPTVGWLTLALFSYAFASTIWAPRPDLSMNIWVGRLPYVLTVIVLAPLLLKKASDIETSFKALLLMGSSLALLLLAFVSWESRMIVLEHGRGNPLAVSEMGGLVALAAILANPWPTSKLWKVARWVIVALCLILVVRSGSRGQLLGVFAIAACCWPVGYQMKSSRQLVAWILLLVFLGGITIWALQEFWGKREMYYAGGNRWSEQAMGDAMSGRFDQGLYLVSLWYKSPETILFGLGNSASFDPRILGIYPHFVPLEILAEEGLIGAVIFMSILYVTARSSLRCYRRVCMISSERLVFATILGMFLFTLLLAFKQGSLLGNLDLFMFAIILAKYEGCLEQEQTTERWKESRSEPGIDIACQYPIFR